MSPASAIDAAAERSEQVRAALEMAREAHAGQVRNASGGRPYIDHPVAVAEQLSAHLADDEALAAALLHDVVEDSELGLDDVRRRCGERVAELVAVLTDDESIEPYEERKREHRGRVEAAGGEAMAIYAADKLTNVMMLRDAYEEQGERVGEELKVPLDEKVGVWEQDLEMLSANGSGSPAVRGLASSLEEQLNALAADRRAAAPPA
jgi:(p)ppGpp synthase/HD superfamily hydrolase